jgi:hypothetical protein
LNLLGEAAVSSIQAGSSVQQDDSIVSPKKASSIISRYPHLGLDFHFIDAGEDEVGGEQTTILPAMAQSVVSRSEPATINNVPSIIPQNSLLGLKTYLDYSSDTREDEVGGEQKTILPAIAQGAVSRSEPSSSTMSVRKSQNRIQAKPLWNKPNNKPMAHPGVLSPTVYNPSANAGGDKEGSVNEVHLGGSGRNQDPADTVEKYAEEGSEEDPSETLDVLRKYDKSNSYLGRNCKYCLLRYDNFGEKCLIAQQSRGMEVDSLNPEHMNRRRKFQEIAKAKEDERAKRLRR